MTENLAIVPQSAPRAEITSPQAQAQSNELAMIKQKVAVLLDSGFLPDTIKTWQQGVAIVLYGHELNVPDWMALKHISVIHGAPSIDGQLALAMMERSGLMEEFVVTKSDTETCTLHIKRKGRTAFDLTCTRVEASTMKTKEKEQVISLTDKYSWKQQPKTMLFYFTVKQAGRRAFSDVLNGMTTVKGGGLEMVDMDEEAVVADMTGTANGQTPPPNPTSAAPEPAPAKPEVAESVEGEIVEEDGLPPIGVKPTLPVDAPQPPPNVYLCDRLKVTTDKAGLRTYSLSVKGSEARIETTDIKPFANATVSGKPIIELVPAIYPLIPMWYVTADKNVDGWDVQMIVVDGGGE